MWICRILICVVLFGRGVGFAETVKNFSVLTPAHPPQKLCAEFNLSHDLFGIDPQNLIALKTGQKLLLKSCNGSRPSTVALLIIRLNKDFSIDRNFATNGAMIFDDGKYCGWARNLSDETGYYIFKKCSAGGVFSEQVLKLRVDGTIDPAFGGGQWLSLNVTAEQKGTKSMIFNKRWIVGYYDFSKDLIERIEVRDRMSGTLLKEEVPRSKWHSGSFAAPNMNALREETRYIRRESPYAMTLLPARFFYSAHTINDLFAGTSHLLPIVEEHIGFGNIQYYGFGDHILALEASSVTRTLSVSKFVKTNGYWAADPSFGTARKKYSFLKDKSFDLKNKVTDADVERIEIGVNTLNWPANMTCLPDRQTQRTEDLLIVDCFASGRRVLLMAINSDGEIERGFGTNGYLTPSPGMFESCSMPISFRSQNRLSQTYTCQTSSSAHYNGPWEDSALFFLLQ